MRLSIGVYVRLLSLCASNDNNECDILKKLVLAVDPSRSYNLDLSYSQRLTKCKNNFSKPLEGEIENLRFADVVSVARVCTREKLIPEFSRNVEPLIKESKKKNLFLAFQDIIKKEGSVCDEAFETYVGMTKQEFIDLKKPNLSKILTGLFLYSILETNVRNGLGCNNDKDKKCAVTDAKNTLEKKRNHTKGGSAGSEFVTAYYKAIDECKEKRNCVLHLTDRYIEEFDSLKETIEFVEFNDKDTTESSKDKSRKKQIFLTKVNLENRMDISEELSPIIGDKFSANDLECYKNVSMKQLAIWKAGVKNFHSVLKDEFYIPIKLRFDDKQFNDLFDVFNNFTSGHFLLVGDGGMGKTTSCFRLWEKLLQSNKLVFYMPLCDYTSDSKIESYIVKNYGVFGNSKQYHSVLEDLFEKHETFIILDGYNEMNIEFNNTFTKDLQNLVSHNNIRVLVTSRTNTSNWLVDSFCNLFFDDVDNNVIDKCLLDIPNSKDRVISKKMYKLLKNPMLLQVYIGNLVERQTYRLSLSSYFEDPVTAGELLSNFIEHQIAKESQFDKMEGESRIFFQHFLPFLAYHLEKYSKHFFSFEEIISIVDNFTAYLKTNECKPTDFALYKKALSLFTDNEDKEMYIINKCINNTCVIKLRSVANNKTVYAFNHQHLRDAFFAKHIINRMILKDRSVFTERKIPIHLCQMISEILCERKKGENFILRGYITLFKNEFNKTAQIAVFNALQIIVCACGLDLTNEDFSELDMRQCVLYGKDIRNTMFNKSYIGKNVFFPQYSDTVVQEMAISPDGIRMATVSGNNKISIWDIESGLLLRTFNGHNSPIKGLVYIPNSSLLASFCASSLINIWDETTGILISSWETNSKPINYVKVSFDGKYLVTASKHNIIIEFWEIASGTIKKSLAPSEFLDSIEGYADLALDPLGNYMAAISDTTIFIWDIENHFRFQRWTAHTQSISSICFNDTGRHIATCSRGKDLKIWDVTDKHIVLNINTVSTIAKVHFGFKNNHIASVNKNNELEIWDVNTGALKNTVEESQEIKCSVLSSDGSYIYTNTGAKIKRRNITDLSLESSFGTISSIGLLSAFFSPCDSLIVSSDQETVKVWDANTGELIRSMSGHAGIIYTAIYSSDMQKIVSASGDGTVKVWNANNGVCLMTLAEHKADVYIAIFSTNGEKIISASMDDTVKIWDSKDGNLVAILAGHTKGAHHLSNGVGGKFLSISGDCKIRIWSDNGELLNCWIGGCKEDEPYKAEFSSDGKYIVSSHWKKRIKVWNAENGSLIKVWDAEKNFVNCAVFSPDSQHILSASDEGELKIWNVCDGSLALELLGHSDDVFTASYSNDGQRIISASTDGEIKIWCSSSGELIMTIYNLSPTNMIGTCLSDVRYDDLTDIDILTLRQNGAIF